MPVLDFSASSIADVFGIFFFLFLLNQDVFGIEATKLVVASSFSLS
jgi:hypothetical protein